MESFVLYGVRWGYYGGNLWLENVSPKNKKIVQFERDLWNLANELKSQKLRLTTKKNIKISDRSDKVLVLGNKTSKIYKLDGDIYIELIIGAVTLTYEKVPDKTNDTINAEDKPIIKTEPN